MTHNPLSREFTRKLERIGSFAELVEGTLVARANELDAQLSAMAVKLHDEQRQDLYEYYAEDYVELSDELPTVLRYAVLTSADTALETYVNNTCETFAELRKARIKVDDFNGKGIRRAKEYLKKVAGIAFPDALPIWTTVWRLHEIRNCIVHAEGYVAPTKTELRQWSGSIDGFRVSTTGVISLGREFMSEALAAYEEFAVEFDESCAPLGLWGSVFPAEDV